MSFSGVVLFVFFFFKQKTAYELRISDWSSDVCSSDLGRVRHLCPGVGRDHCLQRGADRRARDDQRRARRRRLDGEAAHRRSGGAGIAARRGGLSGNSRLKAEHGMGNSIWTGARSEEHTSELQSLMRISYAVFCLKKKKNKNDNMNNKYAHRRHTTNKKYN